MSELELAFQRWVRGQVLLPEHFLAEEEAIVAHVVTAARLRGLPFYGVGRLAWSQSDLARGHVAVSELTVVFPGGRLLVVSANAGITNLDLAKITPPVRRATLFLHLIRDLDPAPLKPRFDADAPSVTRAFYRLRLSTEPSLDDALESIQLASLELDKLGGTWSVSEAYVPPLLQIGCNPFLRARLQEVKELTSKIERRLESQLEDPLFRGERMAAARRCQAGAARLRLLLEEYQDVDDPDPVNPHPYVIFDAIRAYDFELAALGDRPPDPVRYRHRNLAACFDELIMSLRAKAGGEPVSSPSLAFVQEGDDRPYVAGGAKFKAEFEKLAGAAEVFLVVDRRGMSRTPLGKLKLASPGRLDEVNQRSLPGVTWKEMPSPPPFRHTFGPQVDFYQLDVTGAEWKRVRDAGALAYQAIPDLARVRTALFWRNP